LQLTLLFREQMKLIIWKAPIINCTVFIQFHQKTIIN
jgi:hypothetical protein